MQIPQLDAKTGLGLAGMLALLILGLVKSTDVAMSIAAIAIGAAGAHAYENSQTPDPPAPSTDIPKGN